MSHASLSLRLRAVINRWRRKLWRVLFFRMLFGEVAQGGPAGQALPRTRISPSACIEHEERLTLGDDVFIGHFNFIEASSGVTIGRGTQITNFISIVSHSTHRSVRVAARLSGLSGVPAPAADGSQPSDIRAPIAIGAHCFVGPHSVIEAGSTLGKGCLVTAGSRVRGSFGDFAVISGNPAQVVGDTRQADARWLAAHPQYLPAYERWAGQLPKGFAGSEGPNE
ncbi:MAG: acyltransferase [Brachymonas sp.]|nr:acyltransferase [Brachymonas sp.]